jgi:glutamate--cysteine ligase
LTSAMLPLAVQAAMVAIEKICPEAKNLLLIPENHSNNANNTFYLSSIAQLRRIFHMAGLHVRIGSIDPDIKQNTTVELPNGESIVLEPVIRTSKRLGLKDFDPCTILLNNELTKGLPGILEELHEQFVLPPLHASGSIRRKSTHYKTYDDVCKRFGKLLGVDPWLINPMFLTCTDADLPATVDTLLAKIKKKYKEYGITDKPFVVVKTNHSSTADKHAGTGVMMLRQSSELKDHKDIASFSGELVVQEGVLTKERMNDAVAEPVVYMMDRYVVGGFYRVHADRGMDENLCSPGSRYVPLAFAEGTELPQPGVKPGASAPNRFYMYGVIGRLAMLAASYELEATDPEAETYD